MNQLLYIVWNLDLVAFRLGPLFDIHDNEHVHIGVEDGIMSSKCKGEVREMDSIQLARAIE